MAVLDVALQTCAVPYLFRQPTVAELKQVSAWRYDCAPREEPYAGVEGRSEFVADDGGNLVVAFCSFGRNADWHGVADDERLVWVAWYRHPDLVGSGGGTALVRACAELAAERSPGRTVRAHIRPESERSRRAAERAGFELVEARERLIFEWHGRPRGPIAAQTSRNPLM
jgi:RimJ/RimL family protein N-acetyltransferase